jgi:cell division protein FtsQ
MAKQAPQSTSKKVNWRLVGRVFVWTLIAASTLGAARTVHRWVMDDPRFIMVGSAADSEDNADFIVQGIGHASRERIVNVFAEDFGKNIFLMPIDERRRQLLAIDWIREATVARLWPNRIAIKVEERTPVAFLRLAAADPLRPRAARPALIDADGVILEQPEKAAFSFPVIVGITERQGEPERKQRVTRMLKLLRDIKPVLKDVTITEVDVSEQDLRMSAEVENSEVELLMGDRQYARRMHNFLVNYPEIHKRSPELKYFDLRLEKRIIAREAAE